MRRIALPLLCMVMIVGVAAADDTRASVMPNARAAAMGGRHVALADDMGTLFSNPAGFAAQPSLLNVSSLAAQASGRVFDIANLLMDGSASDPNALLGLFDANHQLYTQVDSGGPVGFSYVGNGLGFGFFNRTWAEVNAASLINVSVDVSEEILLVGGYAYRFKLGNSATLDLGVMPKGFLRYEIPYKTNILGLSSVLMNYDSLLLVAPFRMTTGIGIDAGMRISAGNAFTFAVAAQDAYTPTFISEYSSFSDFQASPRDALVGSPTTGLVPCDLSAGVYYDLPLGKLERYITSVELMADYSDILSLLDVFPPNPILLFSAGAEVTLHDIFHIRGGFNQGAFSAGFGLDLTLFNLDIAMYGSELGKDLGERTVYNLLVAFNFNLM